MGILRSHAKPLIFLVLLPVAANAIALFTPFNTDPTLPFIGLAQNLQPGWVPGPMGWLDPTVAFIVQPQGYLAAADWLHGIIPWWNPYAGLGMPLAAEMQAFAFFLPFVLLLHFSAGWLILRVVLQAMCGVFAYALFIELRLTRAAATLGGALFALSPIFYLSPHAAMAPLPFLPLLLLGIEHTARSRASGRSLIIIAIAGAIYAGFPETAYFDGLLAGVWSLWRATTLPPAAWAGFFARLLFGLALGTALSLPLLIPFLDYVRLGDLAGHSNGGFSAMHLIPQLAVLQIFPDAYGMFDSGLPHPLDFIFQPKSSSFVRLPGWVSIPALALAFAALARPGPRRGLRFALAAWVAVWEARYLGFPPATCLVNLIPGIASSDAARFTGPAVDFALYALAAFGLDDFQRRGPISRWRLTATLSLLAAILLAAILPVLPFLATLYRLAPPDAAIAAAGATFASVVLGGLCAELRRPRHPASLALLLIAGPLAGFMLPQLAGHRAGTIDQAPIRYLQAHLGTARMMSLGPFNAAFPTRDRLASIDYAGMPAPALWTSYIRANLFSDTDLNIYRGGAPGEQDAIMALLPRYEALGVRYVVTNPDAPLIPAKSFSPLDLNNYNAAQPLAHGLPDLAGSITTRLPFPNVTGISVIAGTYAGAARGPVIATFCAAAQCATATADAATAGDNAAMAFTFPQPLPVPPGAALSYRFSHPSGKAMSIWLVPDRNGNETPSLTFYAALGQAAPRRVFQDNTAAIFELPNPAPYAQTANPACTLAISTRQDMHTTCPAATTLLRREMFYPGWAATVNGAPVPVSQAGLFQSIPIPAGEAEVRFTYAPPHIRLACGIALFALIIWVGSGRFFEKKLCKKLLLLKTQPVPTLR